MKKTTWSLFFFTIFLMITFPAHAQESLVQALKLLEVDQDGGHHVVPLRGGIVDINSTISIRLDKNSVRQDIITTFGIKGFPKDKLDKMQKLQFWAQQGKAALPGVDKALQDLAASKKTLADFKTFELAMDAAVKVAEQILVAAISESGPLEQAINNRLNEGDLTTTDTYRIVFEEAANYANIIRDSLDAVIQNESVYIALGAWIRTNSALTPLHLAGFDVYPPGENYEVPRWSIAPTQEQIRQISDITNLAQQFNADEIGFKDILVTSAKRTFAVVLEVVDSCSVAVRTEIDSVLAQPTGLVKSVRDDIENLTDNVKSYGQMTKRLADKYSSGVINGDLNTWISGVAQDLSTVETQTKNLVQQFKGLFGAEGILAKVKSTSQNTQQKLDSLKTTVQQCTSVLESQIAGMANKVRNTFSIAGASNNINTEALEFATEVTKHDIEKLPAKTTLDLNFTGQRKSGDAIAFKLGVGRVNTATATSAEAAKELEGTTVRLYQVLPHLKTAVGMIFVDPRDSTGIQRRFQVAASYSVLLKWGSRKSIRYNKLINFGIGLNFSALDFNKDDTPELGIAAVGTIFQDYLQAGYGYNVYEDSWYWFFGIHMPMPTLPVP